jgi:hypothetical protein
MVIGRTIGIGECAIIVGILLVVILITVVSIRVRRR